VQVKAKLQSYEELEFSITTFAPVADWRLMVQQIEKLNKSAGVYSTAWPLGGFVACIRKMLEDLDKTHADVLIKEKGE
jgi:hypothetical protein